ncbi:MAG: sterol desaturase family protein [Polyangiales bacterium]|nr:sterol desaturase family protein [Myxococcales bacterium]MCA9750837.1 sterol desaturase family protein [Gemmatimonadota bacterium]
MKHARWVEGSLLGALLLAGLFCPQGPAVFYGSLALAFVGVATPILVGAALVTLVAERRTRLQGPRRAPRLVWRSAKDTMLAVLVAACFLAWPFARLWVDAPTGLVWTVDEAGGLYAVIFGNLAALVVLDAWLYWKHRLLHTRLLFPFHRAHHAYRDPTAFASFAVGTVESVLTFWPIVLLAFPWATHYAPVYFGLVGGFVLLNLYLHCGATSRLVEATLPRLGVNTSAFHNRHHANANVNFGEAMIVWDLLMGSHEAAVKARRT